MKSRKIVGFSIGLWLCYGVAVGASLPDFGELPREIQACLGTGSCYVAGESDFELDGIAAYRYLEFGGYPVSPGYLIRYPLLPPSSAVDAYTRRYGFPELPAAGDTVTIQSLQGEAWLRVQDQYPESGTNGAVVLYVDQITPSEHLLPRYTSFPPYPTELHFELTPASLQAGYAFRFEDAGFIEPWPPESTGDLIAEEPLVPCLAQGCQVKQELSLIGLMFAPVGGHLELRFAPDDHRSVLYAEWFSATPWSLSQSTNYLGTRTYVVQPIPLPAAWLLWLSGFTVAMGLSVKPKP